MSVGSPEALIHTWYATQGSLTALVPDARFVTGHMQDEANAPRPYATVNIRSAPGEFRSQGSGQQEVTESEVVIDWFGDDWQSGRDYMDAFKTALNNTSISATDIDSRLVRLTADEYIQEPDRVWHFMQTYDCHHEST